MPSGEDNVDILINSFLLVAAGEMGDKTQLLTFVLASRFRKPWAIILGILVATLLNHFMAASLGSWISAAIPPFYLKWILGLIFFIFAAWILVPDKDTGLKEHGHWGAFFTTTIAFFLAEMGDKTQLATVALAAKYESIIIVTMGTTLGMLFSNGLVVFLGEKITKKVPMKWVRIASAFLFLVFGVAIIIGY